MYILLISARNLLRGGLLGRSYEVSSELSVLHLEGCACPVNTVSTSLGAKMTLLRRCLLAGPNCKA